VLEMDSKGNLYLYKSALLCKNEIIKRLTEGNYKLAEPSILGINTLFYLFVATGNGAGGGRGGGGTMYFI